METILLYSPLYDFVVEDFINKLNEIPTSEDITIRVNSPGGSVFAGWGLIAAISEREGKVNIKVDGNASSMTFFMLLYADNVESLDVTQFMIHRADTYIDSDEDKSLLDSVNKDLKAKIQKKFDSKIFKEVTGYSIDNIFDAEKRTDIWITAKDAKKIGLVQKINKLDPVKIAAYDKHLVGFFNKEEPKQKKIITNQTNKKMNIQELKAEHGELHTSIINSGIETERKRVNTWMKFDKIDAEAVKKGIESGKEVDSEVIADFSVKAISKNSIEVITDDSPEAIALKKETAEKSQKELETKKFADEVMANAGIKIEETK